MLICRGKGDNRVEENVASLRQFSNSKLSLSNWLHDSINNNNKKYIFNNNRTANLIVSSGKSVEVVNTDLKPVAAAAVFSDAAALSSYKLQLQAHREQEQQLIRLQQQQQQQQHRKYQLILDTQHQQQQQNIQSKQQQHQTQHHTTEHQHEDTKQQGNFKSIY